MTTSKTTGVITVGDLIWNVQEMDRLMSTMRNLLDEAEKHRKEFEAVVGNTHNDKTTEEMRTCFRVYNSMIGLEEVTRDALDRVCGSRNLMDNYIRNMEVPWPPVLTGTYQQNARKEDNG